MSDSNNKLSSIWNLFKYTPRKNYEFSLPETMEEKAILDNPYENKDEFSELKPLEDTNKKVNLSLKQNLDFIKSSYNYLINSDIKIREFIINVRNKQYNAFIIFIDGMVETISINQFILQTLMLKNKSNTYTGNIEEVSYSPSKEKFKLQKKEKLSLSDYISQALIPQADVKEINIFSEIIDSVNSGGCALFVDTIDKAFVVDTKGFEKRSIAPPQNELVIRGPQEAFIENIRTNTSLIRRGVNNENLVIENINVGTVSKTKCAICYIKDIANDDLVAEVKYRINNLSIDYLLSSGHLEQLISDNPSSSLPQVLSTERPDTSITYLLEGRVVVLINGSPYALVMPANIFDFLTSIEDTNLNYKFANLLKFLRVLASFITLFLPGIYIAITTFHQELLPTELLFSITSARSGVPFPIIVEIFLMEISFELIREAGLRVPASIGSTIGIIGAIVLGEASVSANLVSPILIIIVAVTGISSFAIPNFSLSFHFRITRFIYTILGATSGFLGISLGIFVYIGLLCSLKSFGVSYLTPYVPLTKIVNTGYFSNPIWKREKRTDTLNTKRLHKQEHISMKWRQGGNIDEQN